MATGHLGPKFLSQGKANYICWKIGLLGTLEAISLLSVSGNQGARIGPRLIFQSGSRIGPGLHPGLIPDWSQIDFSIRGPLPDLSYLLRREICLRRTKNVNCQLSVNLSRINPGPIRVQSRTNMGPRLISIRDPDWKINLGSIWDQSGIQSGRGGPGFKCPPP